MNFCPNCGKDLKAMSSGTDVGGRHSTAAGAAGSAGNPDFLDVPEVARKLGTSESTVYKVVKSRKRQALTVGRRLRVSKKEIDRVLSGDIDLS